MPELVASFDVSAEIKFPDKSIPVRKASKVDVYSDGSFTIKLTSSDRSFTFQAQDITAMPHQISDTAKTYFLTLSDHTFIYFSSNENGLLKQLHAVMSKLKKGESIPPVVGDSVDDVLLVEVKVADVDVKFDQDNSVDNVFPGEVKAAETDVKVDQADEVAEDTLSPTKPKTEEVIPVQAGSTGIKISLADLGLNIPAENPSPKDAPDASDDPCVDSPTSPKDEIEKKKGELVSARSTETTCNNLEAEDEEDPVSPEPTLADYGYKFNSDLEKKPTTAELSSAVPTLEKKPFKRSGFKISPYSSRDSVADDYKNPSSKDAPDASDDLCVDSPTSPKDKKEKGAFVSAHSTEATCSNLEAEDEEDAIPPEPTIVDYGYKFNSDGNFVSIRNENVKFEFNAKPDDRNFNQKRYEEIGEAVTNEVYALLESRCGLKRVTIPVDAANGEPTSFMFVSEDVETNAEKLLVLIHGSGVVRAGQWARRLLINEGLKTGSQIPYIEKAKALGFAVVVLNTNLIYGPSSTGMSVRIRGSESPEKHGIYCWEKFIANYPAKHIAIVAHSAGGSVTTIMASANEPDFVARVFAVAFTDSWCYCSRQRLSQHFEGVSVNWVTSHQPVDTLLSQCSPGHIEQRSAGTMSHETSSAAAFDAIWGFFERRLKRAQRKRTHSSSTSPDEFEDALEQLEDYFTVDAEFADVALLVENNRLFANRTFLAILSPAFKRMFFGQDDTKDREVPLEFGSYELVKGMLLLCKSNGSEANKVITDENVAEMLKLAKFYELPPVATACEDFILRKWRFDEEKIVDGLRLAVEFGLSTALAQLVAKPNARYPSILTERNMRQVLQLAKDHQLANVLAECEKELLRTWRLDPKKLLVAVELALEFRLTNAAEHLLKQNGNEQPVISDDIVEPLLHLSYRYINAGIKADCEQYLAKSWMQKDEFAFRAVELAEMFNFPNLLKIFVPLAACRPLAEIDAALPHLGAKLYAAILHARILQLDPNGAADFSDLRCRKCGGSLLQAKSDDGSIGGTCVCPPDTTVEELMKRSNMF